MPRWVKKKTSRESRKAALRTTHWLAGCQVVFTKRCHRYYCHHCYCHYSHYYYCQKWSFWVWSKKNFRVVTIFFYNSSFWVLSQFSFVSFVTISVLLVWSQFEFLGFVIIWVVEFCHNLSFWVLSQLVFLSFVTIWIF